MRLSAVLERIYRSDPEGVATVSPARTRTWTQVHADVLGCSGALRRTGVAKGDPVAILALNDDRWVDIYFACWRIGAVVVPLNIRLSPRELRAQLQRARIRFLVTDEALATLAGEVASLDQGDEAPAIVPFAEITGRNDAPADDAGAGGDDRAGIFFTGGATGLPKGVVLTHSNLFLASVSGMLLHDPAEISAILHTAPLFHLSGAVGLISGTMRRSPHLFMPKFEPADTLRLIAAYGPRSLTLAPAMLQMLLDHPDFGSTDLASLKTVVYGSAPMPEALLRRAIRELPDGVGFIQGYGMTEAAGGVSFLLPRDHDPDGAHPERLRSAGRPSVFAELRIVDWTTGQECQVGATGEVWIRSPTIMQGYLDDPAATDAVMDAGWYRSGDVGHLDAHGYLYITDRMKDMIVSGGENVYSAEVEGALAEHPAIAQSAVFGVPDERWGERVHAVVVLRAGSDATPDDIIAHCRTRIAGYKVPRSLQISPDALPLSAAGKVQKHVLREPFWAGRARAVN